MAALLQRGSSLGLAYYRLRSFHGAPMRVAHDLLKSVVFLAQGEKDALRFCGTAFLLLHKAMLYLVTARHVAEGLGDNPFKIRINTIKGSYALLSIDMAMEQERRFRWFGHLDEHADVAVLPFPIDFRQQPVEVEAVVLRSTAAVDQKNPMEDAGCGDMCHVIGLFAMRSGKQRNIAVVHTGHIAALSDSRELIPTRAGKSDPVRDVEGYLVEISNLPALSGSPAFVRGGLELGVPIDQDQSKLITVATPELKLLGVWQGSWETNLVYPNERVPIGMGVVTPVYRLIELLDSEPVTENRKRWLAKQSAATMDSEE